MRTKYTNLARTTIAISLSSVATSLVVTSGSVFPSLASGDYFYATIKSATNQNDREIVKCTARSGETLTIARAQGGTTAKAFGPGDYVSLGWTREGFIDGVTQHTGLYNVHDYGAVGDGTADDSSAISACLTAAAAAGCGVILPPGTYRLGSYLDIPSNTAMVGYYGLSKLYLPANMTRGTSIAAVPRCIFGVSKSNISFTGIEFYSVTSGLSQVVSIAFELVSGLRIEDCKFRDFGDGSYYAQGLVMYQCTDVVINKTRFENCSGDGLAMSNTCERFHVTNNTFKDNDDWGCVATIGCTKGVISNNIFINNADVATGVDRCTNVVISNNTMYDHVYGVRVAEYADTAETNRNISITGNQIYDASTAGISIENTASRGIITVSGNTIDTAPNVGIRVINATNVAISGNSIYNSSGAAVLFEATAAGFETGRSTVSGNSIDTCNYGVQQVTGAGTTSKVTVVGNNIQNASVTAVSGSTIDYVDGDGSASYLRLNKAINLPGGESTGAANAGASGAPPATVQGYVNFWIGGVQRKVPYYVV